MSCLFPNHSHAFCACNRGSCWLVSLLKKVQFYSVQVYSRILHTKIISITQIMIASIKTGLKAKLRERGSIIRHHLDHSCLIYQEMFFRITFCLDWDVLSMSDWLDANMENIWRKSYRNIILSCLNKRLSPRLDNIVTFLLNSPIY